VTSREVLITVVVALGIFAFFTWALEVHRTMREILTELRRIRDELADRDQR
jgi:hypothetical protein